MDAGDPWDGSPVVDSRKLLEGTVEAGISRSRVPLDEGKTNARAVTQCLDIPLKFRYNP